MSVDDTSGREDRTALVAAIRSSLAEPTRAIEAGHIETLAAAHLAAPSKLAMLARLKDEVTDRDELLPLAESLVRDDLDDGEKLSVAEQLVDRVVHAPGRDPLGRTGLDADPATQALMDSLVPQVASSSLAVLPSCEANRVNVSGSPVLFVKTTLWSTTPLQQFVPVIDPLEWPKCPVQSHFFKSMELQTPKDPLPKPDKGWKATVRETVDFGFGTGEMVTDLDVVFHSNPGSIGCTYVMAPGGSQDGKILHDEGYLLAEDLEESRGARRVTTMKAVWFSDENTPADEVCPVWSLAAGLVAHMCLQEAMQ
jgi:hypothetical protein